MVYSSNLESLPLKRYFTTENPLAQRVRGLMTKDKGHIVLNHIRKLGEI